MNYSIAIFFGLAPSFIWLFFFLRKDSHPESNQMILKIFGFGMAIALVAALVELGIASLLGAEIMGENLNLLGMILYNLLGIAFIEEILKYLVVRRKILSSSAFDEPVDAVLYMIIAALGFAALENILILTAFREGFPFVNTIVTSAVRFIGATFLHALASGTLGFFLALSIFHTKKRTILILTGIASATVLHTVYNLFIIRAGDNIFWALPPLILLVFLAFFVSFGFKKLKKITSVCKLK